MKKYKKKKGSSLGRKKNSYIEQAEVYKNDVIKYTAKRLYARGFKYDDKHVEDIINLFIYEIFADLKLNKKITLNGLGILESRVLKMKSNITKYGVTNLFKNKIALEFTKKMKEYIMRNIDLDTTVFERMRKGKVKNDKL